MLSDDVNQHAALQQSSPTASSVDAVNYEGLRAENERLKLALEASGVVGLWDWMVDTNLLHGDTNFARLYGLDPSRTAAGLTMEQYQEFVIAGDIPALQQNILATFESGADFLVEYRLAIPNEPIRWVECKGKLICDVSGRAVRFSGTAVDITERKQQEAVTRAAVVAARENSERMHLALAAGAIIGTWVWDIGRDEFSLDEGLANAFGLDTSIGPAAPRIARIIDAVHPDDKPALLAAVESALHTRSGYICQYRVKNVEGLYYWVEANGRVESDVSGRAYRFPGVLINISARRAVENERDKIAAELRTLNLTLEQRISERTAERDLMWETSPDLLLIIDFEGYFCRVNPAWKKLLGYCPQELVGHHVNEFVVRYDHAKTVEAYEAAATGTATSVENCYRHKDGSLRWFSWVAAPAGDLTYATGRDVTIEKERAATLLETQEALRQSQKMEAVGQLTGGLAHDFNNLLASISGALQVLKVKLQRGQYIGLERYVDIGESSVRRAASLTQRLLAFSRRQTLDPKPTDVRRLVAGMDELLRRSLGPIVEMTVISEDDLWLTKVDPPQLENALLNLYINARDAMMPGGGRLTLTMSNEWLSECREENDVPAGEYVLLRISDTGTGMPPEVLTRIFDPFYTTKPIGEGTGLGLSMVYGFVRQSEGQVTVTSVLGVGTTMCLYLPRYSGTMPTAESVEAQRVESAQGENVLVIDDETALREIVEEVLRDAGYRVFTAQDGPTGLLILDSNTPIDLLVTDVGLPGGLNGRQVADTARASRPGLKVLFITGYADAAVVGNGRLDEGMEVMTKPFDLSALVGKVHKLIRA